jgi:hypothetical protein
VSWNLRDVTAFSVHSDGSLDVVVLLGRQSEGGMNNFITEDASVIKERVTQGGLAGMGVSPGHQPCHTWGTHKVTMKLRTFLFQMVVTSCISLQYL